MSATVFCTFDQQDLADLAMGRLRQDIHGIHSIDYVAGHGGRDDHHTGFANIAWGYGAGVNSVDTGITPSRPVTMRISCNDLVKQKVVSKLVNLHAYKIVAQ